MRRLPQLSATQINWFDSSISLTQIMRQWHECDEHALYKDNFVTGNGELSKVIADIAVSGPGHTLVKTNIVLEAAEDRLKTAAPLLFANKSTVKRGTWSNSCRLNTLFSELYVHVMRVFSFFSINCQSKT